MNVLNARVFLPLWPCFGGMTSPVRMRTSYLVFLWGVSQVGLIVVLFWFPLVSLENTNKDCICGLVEHYILAMKIHWNNINTWDCRPKLCGQNYKQSAILFEFMQSEHISYRKISLGISEKMKSCLLRKDGLPGRQWKDCVVHGCYNYIHRVTPYVISQFPMNKILAS